MTHTLPTPLPDDPDYFQILIESRITTASTVHLSFTANRMALDSPDILDITWLTGGGANHDDWTKPVVHVVNSETGHTPANGGASIDFQTTYDVTLDQLPKHTVKNKDYRVLKIPFLDPSDAAQSLAGSGHLTITLDAPAVMQINSTKVGYSFALPSPAPQGAGSTYRWDFVELNCATPASNGKSVCFCNTTNVDFFSLGIAIKGRTADDTYSTFGLDLSGSTPVADLINDLKNLPPDYAAGYMEQSGAVLRFLAPDMAFTDKADDLDTAIDAGFTHYETHALTFEVGAVSYSAKTVNDALEFSSPSAFTINKPTTLEVIASTGPLDVAGQSVEIQNAQKYIAAALNRGVFTETGDWDKPSRWYPGNVQSNQYSQTLHQHFIDGVCYGFSFDDVPGAPVTSAPAIGTCTSMSLVITDQ
ncbi:beta-1,3-glucanase family protein [Oceanicaulis sp. LC35]|uniref:beta-1,3-glucanase family protein n=1 Tax=Oceanicaulis sp. LC35 TaxID=3349635 RepID=UPI003F83CD20